MCLCCLMTGSDWCISSIDNKHGMLWNGKQKEHLCLPLDRGHLTDPLLLPEIRQERENNGENCEFILRILWRRQNVDKGLKRPWHAVLRNIYSITLKENQNVLLLNNLCFVANKTIGQLRSDLKKANSSISWKPWKIFKGKHHQDQNSFIILKRKRGKGSQIKMCLSLLSWAPCLALTVPRATSQRRSSSNLIITLKLAS